MVSISTQKWIHVLSCFCRNARLANGKLWDGAEAEMSAGLRSRHHFPHYLILCQVTGETLGGVSLGGCEFPAGVSGCADANVFS